MTRKRRDGLTGKVICYLYRLELRDLAEVTRDKLAAGFRVNPGYLSRKIKEDTGVLLSEWIDRVKIDRAADMLKTRPSRSIEEISMLIGIAKTQRFRIKFKKMKGLNPRQFSKIRTK